MPIQTFAADSGYIVVIDRQHGGAKHAAAIRDSSHRKHCSQRLHRRGPRRQRSPFERHYRNSRLVGRCDGRPFACNFAADAILPRLYVVSTTTVGPIVENPQNMVNADGGTNVECAGAVEPPLKSSCFRSLGSAVAAWTSPCPDAGLVALRSARVPPAWLQLQPVAL
jgi:hypothetical protein